MKYLRLTDVIVTANADQELVFWDLKSSLVLRRHVVQGTITSLAANPTLSLIAVGTDLGFVRIYAVNSIHSQNPTLMMRHRVHSKPVTEASTKILDDYLHFKLSFDSSGRFLSSSSDDGCIFFYDTAKEFAPLGYLLIEGKVRGSSWMWEEEDENLVNLKATTDLVATLLLYFGDRF